MTIQLTIYIVRRLYNCVYSNDYTIDYIHGQMTIQLTIYPIPPQTRPWAYNRILDVWHFLNFKTALVYKPMGL